MTTVEQVLDAAVTEGYLTPLAASEGPAHSAGFLGFKNFHVTDEDVAVDLGAGGGLPGLVLATLTPCRWVLVERSERKSTFLKWAVRKLGLEDQVEVELADAVDVGRSGLRGLASLVTARGFAPPSATAECAAPLLAEQGVLVVSEPPKNRGNRWSNEGLSTLGLQIADSWANECTVDSSKYQAIIRIEPCRERFPRRFPRQLAEPIF